MKRIIFFIINMSIVITPIAAIYFYFTLDIPPIKAPEKEEDLNSSRLDYEQKVSQKLFPEYNSLLKFFEEPKAEPVKTSTLAKDLEKYQLIGISYSGKERSIAIIKNKETNKQILLKIGKILEGAVLTDIDFERGEVTFEKENEKYVMGLTKIRIPSGALQSSLQGPASKITPSALPAAKPTALKRSDWENKKPEEIIKIEKDPYTENLFYTDSASVAYIKENLYKLAGEMYIRPVFTENAEKLLGVKVEQIKETSVFKKVGIREGDIITKINDTTLSSFQEITKLFYGKDLYERKELKFYILRDGKEIKIEVKVND